MTVIYQTPAEIARAIVDRVGPNIVLGLPIGIGKATHVADALFELALKDASLSLTIFTGLTLELPNPKSDFERRLMAPLVERLYSNWPVPRYAAAIRDATLPANIEVHEFYLRPGAFLRSPYVQQRYANINYSQVASELMRLGVNVIAQLVAESEERPNCYSLGGNPEVTLDLLPWFTVRRESGQAALLVGQVSDSMPYMVGDAELEAAAVDMVLKDDACQFDLFALPNRRVSDGDFATAMHVASLVKDGGTIQLGIGSLSDAVAHCLTLRHQHPKQFAEVLHGLPGGSQTQRRQRLPIETERFTQGLYASSELLSDALYSLFTADIVKRPADAETETVMHAGFFIGSVALYSGLRELPLERRRLLDMTRISFVNTLFGDEARKREQRNDARFINETMMVTLLGAAVSDALEDGRVVSGVGGQFDFVSMAQSLDNAMSILMCRARREHRGRVTSNIRWNYGHVTVPRHHRDVYVTEYGIAATGGASDRDIIDRLLHVTDAAFQAELIRHASASGKIETGYTLSADAQNNRPEEIAAVFDKYRDFFPAYPLGSVLTEEEASLAEALSWLQKETATTTGKWCRMISAALEKVDARHSAAFERMGLAHARSFQERLMRKMLGQALDRIQR